MDINTVTEIIKNVDPTQTTKYIGATVGGKMLYDDLASPTIKAAGELGAKIFKALTVNCDIWAENRIKRAHRLQDDIANELKGKSPADITENPPEYILYSAIMQYMHSHRQRRITQNVCKTYFQGFIGKRQRFDPSCLCKYSSESPSK